MLKSGQPGFYKIYERQQKMGKQNEDTFPKYFRTAGIQQNGKIGKLELNNGIIIVTDEQQYEHLQTLGIWKTGVVFPIGKGINVEVKETGAIVKTIPNPFLTMFSEEELILINNIPDDVMEETVKVNIMIIAKEYSNPYDESSDELSVMGDEKEQEQQQEQEELPEDPFPEPKEEPKLEISDKRCTMKWLKEYLEVKGVLYPDKALKPELYDLYLQN